MKMLTEKKEKLEMRETENKANEKILKAENKAKEKIKKAAANLKKMKAVEKRKVVRKNWELAGI